MPFFASLRNYFCAWTIILFILVNKGWRTIKNQGKWERRPTKRSFFPGSAIYGVWISFLQSSFLSHYFDSFLLQKMDYWPKAVTWVYPTSRVAYCRPIPNVGFLCPDGPELLDSSDQRAKYCDPYDFQEIYSIYLYIFYRKCTRVKSKLQCSC